MSSQFIPPDQFSKFKDEEKLLVLEAEALYRERTGINPSKVESALDVMVKYRKWRSRDATDDIPMPSMQDLKVAINTSIEILERELELTKPVDGPWLSMVGFKYVPGMVDGTMVNEYKKVVNSDEVIVRFTETLGILVDVKQNGKWFTMKSQNRGCIDSLIKMLS